MAASVTSLVPENQRPSARCDETSFIAIAVAESPLVPKISPGGAFVGDATKTNAFVVGCAMGFGAAAVNAFVGAAVMGLGARRHAIAQRNSLLHTVSRRTFG